ncbi:hypothetical protein MJO29_009469 [Puccinia striiformis f. sp. tritici]|nr:hypothetical protein Pst134EB_018376 [Puccinia striiformis f. sp. tritici]KAI7950795.1 hypothetical protein MJO29_009469 [Puccinia striiformis f. sp. tritici]KAI9627581.1 hypothetical protein H4Q26_017264 [Puccinia striiformis f. sp. tritici PST-130]
MKSHRLTFFAILGWTFVAYPILSAPWPRPMGTFVGGTVHAGAAADAGSGILQGGKAAANFAADGSNVIKKGGTAATELGHGADSAAASKSGLDPNAMSQLHETKPLATNPAGKPEPKAAPGTPDPLAPHPPEGLPPKEPLSSKLKGAAKSTFEVITWPLRLVFKGIDKVKKAINSRWVKFAVNRLNRSPLGQTKLSDEALREAAERAKIKGYVRLTADAMKINEAKYTETMQNQIPIWKEMPGERQYQRLGRIAKGWYNKLLGRRPPPLVGSKSMAPPPLVRSKSMPVTASENKYAALGMEKSGGDGARVAEPDVTEVQATRELQRSKSLPSDVVAPHPLPKATKFPKLKGAAISTLTVITWPFRLVFETIDKVKQAVNRGWVKFLVNRLNRSTLGQSKLSNKALEEAAKRATKTGPIRKGADFAKVNPAKYTEDMQNQVPIWKKMDGERYHQYLGRLLKGLFGRQTPSPRPTLERTTSTPGTASELKYVTALQDNSAAGDGARGAGANVPEGQHTREFQRSTSLPSHLKDVPVDPKLWAAESSTARPTLTTTV